MDSYDEYEDNKNDSFDGNGGKRNENYVCHGGGGDATNVNYQKTIPVNSNPHSSHYKLKLNAHAVGGPGEFINDCDKGDGEFISGPHGNIKSIIFPKHNDGGKRDDGGCDGFIQNCNINILSSNDNDGNDGKRDDADDGKKSGIGADAKQKNKKNKLINFGFLNTKIAVKLLGSHQKCMFI